MTTYLGVDVSHYQPVSLPWDAWVANGLSVAVVKLTNGTTLEPRAREHLAGAAAAGVPCLGGYAWLTPGNGRGQCEAFLNALTSQCAFAALDIEQAGLAAVDVLNWVATYNQHIPEFPLVLYGNSPLVVACAEKLKLGVWWAEYKDNLPASAPPWPAPHVPAGLRVVGWQWTGHGRLAPYLGDIDLTTWFEMPNRSTAMPTPGAGHGFHGEQTNQIIQIIRRGLALGIHYKGLNSVHNPGRCKDAHDLLPEMDTICRFKFPHTDIGERWENGQNVERWDEAEHLACARAQIQLLFDNTNPTERAGVKFYTPGINEWNLDNELSDWTCVGHHLHLMMDEAERRSAEFGQTIRLAVPGISQGKPEYHQMVEMVKTGCFDRMAARGDLFTIHAGRFPWQDSEAIPGLGVVIPGAPFCPPYGGAYDGRVNYFYALGVKCDFAVTEAYDGYDRFAPPAKRLVRMKQADDLYRHNPHYRFICWYELVDNDDSSWRNTDFTPTFLSPEFEAEMLAQRNVSNPLGETIMPITTAQKKQMRDTGAALLAQIDALVADDAPPPVLHTMSNRSNQSVFNLFQATFGSVALLDKLGLTAGMAAARQAGYTGPAVEAMALTAGEKAALIAAGA